MNLSEKILIIFLAIILIGELFTVSYTDLFQNFTRLDVQGVSQAAGDQIVFNATFDIKQGNSPFDLRLLLMSSNGPPVDKEVYVYYDRNYPTTHNAFSSWTGFVDHIVPSLKTRGYKGNVTIVNAVTLAYVMENYFDSVVIIPSGVFPDTVHTKNKTNVTSFLNEGGTIIWIGEGFAAYSGEYLGTMRWPSDENPGWDSQVNILGYPLTYYNPNPTIADKLSPLSNALDLEYPTVQTGAYINQTIGHDGLVLGKIADDRTSISGVPVGKGQLVVFGGSFGPVFTDTGEDAVALDVGTILLSNVLQSNGQISIQNCGRATDLKGELTLTVDKTEFEGITFLAYSLDDFSYFFQREFFSLSQ